MALRIDLNADLAEGGAHDDLLLDVVTSANLSCGAHAGDPVLLSKTAAAARCKDVTVGAHPSYPDRLNFGRVSLADEFDADTLEVVLRSQFGSFVVVAGAPRYIKPHGALYNDLMVRADFAKALITACHRAYGYLLPLYLPAQSAAAQVAEEQGVKVVAEAFPDRAYLPSGALAPRSRSDAVITDRAEVARRAVQIAMTGTVTDVNGDPLSLRADTLCLHGDSAGARTGAAVAKALRSAGVEVTPWAV